MQYLKVAKISKYVYLLNLEEEKNIDLFVKKKKKSHRFCAFLDIVGHRNVRISMLWVRYRSRTSTDASASLLLRKHYIQSK